MRWGTGSTEPGNRWARPARRILAYAAAVALVALAAIITLLLWEPFFSRNRLAMFYAAVVVAAWFWGIGPGLLASAAAVFLIDYFFTPSFATGFSQHLMQLLAFAFISVLVSWLDRRQRLALHEAQQAQAAAEEASRAKDRFLAVLSHELRTPLTPALAATEAMERSGVVPPNLDSDLQMIKRNIQLEAALIDDLLDLTRITHGKLQLSPHAVEVHQIIRHVLGDCQSEIFSKRLQVVLELQAEASQVTADPARLQQVCWNLIRNAIKFTPHGGTITVRTANAATAGNESRTLRITVSDTGIGIARDLLPRVFAAFEQGDPSIHHRFGGLGLGLAISRQLIAMHGGTLEADSPGINQGATFTITLPDATVPAPVPPPPKTADQPPADESSTARSLRLLLVEDHIDTARVMARLLRAAHHEVEAVGSVGAARAAAALSNFDLLITDLGLPDGTGIELFSELKAQYGLRGIAVSGFGMEDDVQRCLAAGFDAHVTKPVNIDRLGNLIQEIGGQCVN
ncbi:MAG TPA: ATP-binding protein [Tepidisphaeraceae bacterium]|nr:ATP-binding protein [Tepidisphaeraceae bacterium]